MPERSVYDNLFSNTVTYWHCEGQRGNVVEGREVKVGVEGLGSEDVIELLMIFRPEPLYRLSWRLLRVRTRPASTSLRDFSPPPYTLR